MSFQQNPNTQFETITWDITDVTDADILVIPILRLIFVPSSPLFQEQIWIFKDDVLGSQESLSLDFSSVLYKGEYPLGNFTAKYGTLNTTSSKFRLLNKLDGEVSVEPSLGVPLPNGAYTMTQYNYSIQQDQPTSYVKVYFGRGLPIGTGIIVDLINNQLTILTYGSRNGQEVNRQLYSFTANSDIEQMLQWASATRTNTLDLSQSYSNFTLL
jgi:hypothetical protein